MNTSFEYKYFSNKSKIFRSKKCPDLKSITFLELGAQEATALWKPESKLSRLRDFLVMYFPWPNSTCPHGTQSLQQQKLQIQGLHSTHPPHDAGT